VWGGLPVDSKIETLRLEGDLTAANTYVTGIKRAMHEIGDVPEGTLGQMQPISNTSGVALHMQYGPLLERRARKLATYQPGYEQINYFILRIGMTKGLISLPFDLCSSCSGRIVQIDTGKTQKKWDPELQAYVESPVYEKRCYQIDKHTLNFIDPYDVAVKFWRQYGFGKELRTMKFKDIIKEVKRGGESFWDYSSLQKELLKDWYAQNQAPQPAQEAGPDGEPVAQGGLAVEEAQKAADSTVPTPPQILTPGALSLDEIEVPEEPERVTVVQNLVHPDTGESLGADVTEMFLVPTGCKCPAYLNPFENKVEFLDVLPKDEALQAQLFQMYQTNKWVDADWCQSHIPSIAPDAAEIRKRMKSDTGSAPAPQNTFNEQAPPMEHPASVPGEGGNPVPAGKETY
jgi:hypothetical protein